jgi:hypothetical protein
MVSSLVSTYQLRHQSCCGINQLKILVFLHVLEYYAGILFLTTNQIGDFDEASLSRTHISLHYLALNYDLTLEIFDLNWRLITARFKHRGRALEIEESNITGLIADYWQAHPSARWNGRQPHENGVGCQS